MNRVLLIIIVLFVCAVTYYILRRLYYKKARVISVSKTCLQSNPPICKVEYVDENGKHYRSSMNMNKIRTLYKRFGQKPIMLKD